MSYVSGDWNGGWRREPSYRREPSVIEVLDRACAFVERGHVRWVYEDNGRVCAVGGIRRGAGARSGEFPTRRAPEVEAIGAADRAAFFHVVPLALVPREWRLEIFNLLGKRMVLWRFRRAIRLLEREAEERRVILAGLAAHGRARRVRALGDHEYAMGGV